MDDHLADQVRRVLASRGLLHRASPAFIMAVVRRLAPLLGRLGGAIPDDVVDTVALQVGHDRGHDFCPDFQPLLPASLLQSTILAECGFDLALPFYNARPPDHEFKATAVAVLGRFRTRILGPMCQQFLSKRPTFGISHMELRDYAFGRLPFLQKKQHFKPGCVIKSGHKDEFRTWLWSFVVRPSFTNFLREKGIRADRQSDRAGEASGDSSPPTKSAYLRSLLADVEARPGNEPGPEVADEVDKLHRAIARLGPQDQEIIRLHGLRELDYQQVAKLLQITPAAVAQRYSRALRRLREALGLEVSS